MPGLDDIPEITRTHILLSGAPFHPLETIGWIGGTWYLTFPYTTIGKYCCTSSKKLYAEFVMGKHVNYFDMLGFKGVGRGMPQHRPNARNRDSNPYIPTPLGQLPREYIPPTHDMVL